MAVTFEKSRGRPAIGLEVRFVHNGKEVIGIITNFVFDPRFNEKDVSAYDVFIEGVDVKVNWIKCEIVK